MLKEVEVQGTPGNICVIYKINEVVGMPTTGLAWGPFDEAGVYRTILDTEDQEWVQIHEYEPQVAKWLEENWYLNTE